MAEEKRIVLKQGLDADISSAIENLKTGELFYATDTEALYIATTTSGASDAEYQRIFPSVADIDLEITGSSNGVILESPDATRWRIQVDNSGNLTTTSL